MATHNARIVTNGDATGTFVFKTGSIGSLAIEADSSHRDVTSVHISEFTKKSVKIGKGDHQPLIAVVESEPGSVGAIAILIEVNNPHGVSANVKIGSSEEVECYQDAISYITYLREPSEKSTEDEFRVEVTREAIPATE